VDVHQYGGDVTIQVATVGINVEKARKIKQSCRSIRDRLLRGNPGIEPVEFVIEPLDSLEIGAWPAKANGILSVPAKVFTLSCPAQHTSKRGKIYTEVNSSTPGKAVHELSH